MTTIGVKNIGYELRCADPIPYDMEYSRDLGFCAAKYLLEAGFDVTVYEIGSQIGGLWCYRNDNGRSSAYRTLHINTSRGVTRFSDLDFDAATQAFPDHADIHRYLVIYA